MVDCSAVNCKSNTNPSKKERGNHHLKKAWLANLKRDIPLIEQNI